MKNIRYAAALAAFFMSGAALAQTAGPPGTVPISTSGLQCASGTSGTFPAPTQAIKIGYQSVGAMVPGVVASIAGTVNFDLQVNDDPALGASNWVAMDSTLTGLTAGTNASLTGAAYAVRANLNSGSGTVCVAVAH